MEGRMNTDALQQGKILESVSRIHSQELLDSSSASSLSGFADHTERQNISYRSTDVLSEAQKLDGNSPRASMDEALKSEAAFIQYVMSIPSKESCEHHRSADSMSSRTKASSSTGPAVSKVGLDHLDNLCKLMEQLSELKDTNSKLQKRVQYLEDLKTLHDMHKEICEGGEYSSEDALTPKPELYKLKKSATESHCLREEESVVLGSSRSPSKYFSRRSRHQQAGAERRGRSKSVGHEDLGEDPKSRRLFPKWSKVKEAFGWESERKGSIKVKSESGSMLTPRRRSDESRQIYRHPGSPTWYQECPSIHSSIGEIDVDFEEDRWKKVSVVSEKYISHLDARHESLRRQKSSPSPGSDKVASYREATEIKAKASTIERDTYRNQDFSKFDKEECKRGKSPWGRVKTIIERHRDSLKRRSLRRDNPAMDCESIVGKNSQDALDFKAYSDYLESSSKQPMSTGAPKQKGNKPVPIVLDAEDCSGPRTPCSSPTFQRKSRWNRMTKAWKGKKECEREQHSLSTPTSPNNDQDGNFTFDVIEEISPDTYGEEKGLSRVESDSHVHQLALAVSSSDLMLQLQRNLSEDFHRKIQEWERIRSSGITSHSPNWDRKQSDGLRTRKKSERDDKGIKPKIKDLTWLEKELQKIEKEKQRLSKERQKYEERALRLEKLKETVLSAKNSSKREVFVRTSAGEFRFEGISDAFTKKLYEWETKRGVGPELSTIALLDSSRPLSDTSSVPKIGPMQRLLSRSESSIADIGQPSHHSSNSLPSVKMPDSSEADKQNYASRANSEPDLTALVAYGNGTNLSVSTSTRMVTTASDGDITSPAAHKESEEDDFDGERKGSETYYELLEENVILLEQLKEKEEICRRLEKDLEILDEKMDEMNVHHVQETQLYREKLWEMHQQGASPRDVQCCRHTMLQLRKRIEYLESLTEKLRIDREVVEINFRHHSKEQETMTLDLLEKMRELQAAGASTTDCGIRHNSQLDSSAIERLQDLSALLTKQTQDLEATLSQKTRQICQLKWELLHRDLSSVKKETEQHSHTAHKKRSKYAQWRSRSSEEASASKTDYTDYAVVATNIYCTASPEDDFKATHLANTVQELNREVLKLTSGSSLSSLAKCLQAESAYSSVSAIPSTLENHGEQKKFPSTAREHLKKITVRRSSADNLSLVSSSDVRSKKDNSSTTHSEDSSEEYYSRVSYNVGVKTDAANTSDTERLLMSYGEYAPRSYAQRRKKVQKVSKLLGRKRSNTFHTNRDLQKPVIIENVPHKCQSFRETRKTFSESSVPDKEQSNLHQTSQNSSINIKNPDEIRRKMSEERILQQVISLGNLEYLRKYDTNWLREVSSDSKIPFLMQTQNYTKDHIQENNCVGKSPIRSMSDKTKKETAAERREHMQKKRSKKKLKSPDSFVLSRLPGNAISNSTSAESLNSKMSENITNQTVPNSCIRKSLSLCSSAPRTGSEKENSNKSSRKSDLDGCQSNIPSSTSEIPTVTIQLPKRKQRKASSKDAKAATVQEEQSVTIYMPKKRSFSSDPDSSISDNSPRDTSKVSHSNRNDESSNFTSPFCPVKNSYTKDNLDTNGNIRLMRLVSLDNFDTPFGNKAQSIEPQPRKRKANYDELSRSNTPTEEMIDMISTRGNSCTISKSYTANLKYNDSDHTTSPKYIKSPSAPQLEWRKVCAKKISKEGAPNVRTLIEKYNQKLVETQTCKSPLSSNVSSPASVRKTSTPISSCTKPEIVPHFCSTPNTPTAIFPYSSPLSLKTSNASFSVSPPPSPMSVARSEALRRAKENFIASQNSATTNTLMLIPTTDSSQATSTDFSRSRLLDGEHLANSPSENKERLNYDRSVSADDRMSNSSMDSMNLVMLRAGENCRESRMPKRIADTQKTDASSADGNKLKTSKSLSSSSLFKAVLSSDFKMPTNLLKLKRSKRKKDMSTVTELCRQSLLLTSEDVKNIPSAATHKSCPSSPELKTKSVVKSNWLHRNIFRHK